MSRVLSKKETFGYPGYLEKIHLIASTNVPDRILENGFFHPAHVGVQ